MEPEGSSPRLQKARLYPEPGESSPCLHPTYGRPILTLSSWLHLRFPSDLFPSEACMHISFPPYMPHSPPISFLLISSIEHADHETPHCAVSFSPLLPRDEDKSYLT